MRDDFAIFILTHGRPDRVHTVKSLLDAGYTGKFYIVVDNEDKTIAEYRKKFGDRVLVFDKAAQAKTFDEGDNFDDRRAIIYARNASYDLALSVGVRLFMQMDDDYTSFSYRFDAQGRYGYWSMHGTMDAMILALLDFYESIPAAAIAISQGGDWMSAPSTVSMRRKAMNSFVCSVDRRFEFSGRINEDVNTYTSGGRRGMLFLTVMQAMLMQKATQSQAGGMTGIYLDSGTYLKSFYSVMYCPSAVKVGCMGHKEYRLHHAIEWRYVAPMILRENEGDTRRDRSSRKDSPQSKSKVADGKGDARRKARG